METIDKAVGLEIRSVQVRSVDTETREISGLAVPYGQVTNIGTFKERFERGVFGDVEDVKLFYGHSEPIGLVTKGADSDDGFVITARISNTPRGEEVYTLMKDGVLNRFSVGFLPVEHREEGDVVVRTKATLKEVSVVAFPAYEGAKVSEVREDAQKSNTNSIKEDITMSNDTQYASESEVADLRGSLEDLERRVAIAGDSKKEETSVAFRSGGTLLKGLADADSSAQKEVRAFTGANTGDSIVTPAWVNESMRLSLVNRNFLNLWSKGALPTSGNSIEYPRVTGESGTVGVQAAEGDDLPYMEVTLGTATAPVKTYGGYSSLSRQVIERSDVPYLETVLEFQVRQYAKATNAAVLAAFKAGTGYNTAAIATATAKGADWLSTVFGASALIEDNSKGSSAGFILMNRANFLKVLGLTDTTGRPVFDLNNDGSNTYGNLQVGSVAGSLAGLPIVVDNALTNAEIYVAASDAVKVFESAGAPYRLADENIINLTKDFSLYGYMAVALPNPLSVVKVTVS